MPEEAADGGESIVTARCGIATLRLEVKKKRLDRIHLQVGELQVCHGALLTFGQIGEEQSQCVPIGPHGMRARPTHPLQMILEEGLYQGQQAIRLLTLHDLYSTRFSRRFRRRLAS